MAIRLFNSAVECMNRSCVKIYVDSSYNKEIADYYKDNNESPIYDVVGEECVSFKPIVELVNMTISKVTFRFAENEDIVLCSLIVKKYLEHLATLGVTSKTKSLSDDDREIIENCEQALIIFKGLSEHYNMVHKKESTDPETLLQLIPKNWR